MSDEVIRTFADNTERDNASFSDAEVGKLVRVLNVAGAVKLYEIQRAGTGSSIFTDTEGGGGGYATIQEEGSPLAQETILDFQGAGVTATAGAGKTVVTIPGGTTTAEFLGTSGADVAIGTAAFPAAGAALHYNGLDGEWQLPVDANAIHDQTAGEIQLITEKLVPVAADLLLIEDSNLGGYTKKRIQIGNLPGGGGGGAWFSDGTAVEPTVITLPTGVSSNAVQIPLSATPSTAHILRIYGFGSALEVLKGPSDGYHTNAWETLNTVTRNAAGAFPLGGNTLVGMQVQTDGTNIGILDSITVTSTELQLNFTNPSAFPTKVWIVYAHVERSIL